MAVRRFVVPITTIADGSATAYSPAIYGKLVSISYVKTDFANGVDFAITTETTEETLWAESNVDAAAVRHPKAATHSVAGAASLYAALGEPVLAPVGISGDRVKIVIASGGDTKAGAFHITVDG